MEAALRELQAAKEEIERLKKVRDDAQRDLVRARELTDSTPPQYGDKTYWQQRYEHVDSNANKEDDTYEWYASYEMLKDLISASISRCSDKTMPSVLISGCGNSKLGEKLATSRAGSSIVGVDFDTGVVRMMADRASRLYLNNLRYQEVQLNICFVLYDID